MKRETTIVLITAFVLALIAPVMAQNSGDTTNVTVNVPCIQDAIEKRDTAIISAVNTFSSSAVTALETRKTELKAAWEKTNVSERRLALRDAWKKYKKSVTDARKQLRAAKKAAWHTFKTESALCKGTADSTGASADNTI